MSAGNSNGPGTINHPNEEEEVGDSEWHVEWSKDTIHTVVVQLLAASVDNETAGADRTLH